MEPCQPKPIAQWNPVRDVWETPGTEDLFCEHLDVFSETFPPSGIWANGMAYALPTSEPATADGGSSLLPTPTTQDAGRSEQRRAIAARTEHPAAERAGATAGLTLLPTPGANLGDNGGPQHPDKRRAGGHSVSIEDAVHGLTLLPTPSVADVQGGRKARSGDRSGELLLNGIAHENLWGDYAAAIHRHEQMLGRPAPSPTEPGKTGNPRLSAKFAEWMMCLPDGWVTDVPGITRNEALKALGNGVVPQQAIAALEWMVAS